MSQNCPNCGTLNSAAHRFCSNCGTRLSSPTDTTPAPSPGTSTPQQPVTFAVQRWDTDTASEPPIATSPSDVPPAPKAYQLYTPGASARREGFTYAPYGPEAVQQLEKPARTRSWLVPAIVAAVLVLLLLAGVSAYLLVLNKTPAPATGSAPSVTTPLPANASEEDKIKAVVRQSNDDQIKALRNLDTEVLKSTYTGEVLAQNIAMVNDLKQQNMYAAPVNKRLDILDVKVDGDTAIVRTLEVWTVTYYTKGDNTPVKSMGPDTLTETYYMVKQNGSWFVSRLQIDEGTPTPNSN
jgi:hypothetical protein